MDLNLVWEKGKEDEIHFWKLWLPKNYERYSQPRALRSYFVELIGGKKEVSILDVGSGPTSTIGQTWPDTEIKITLSDVLANEYNEIFKTLSITPSFPVEYQDMTNLTYEDNAFDIVHCRNALDHCLDPIKAIMEMVRVCKQGGWIYLSHFTREGKKHRYNGLHQWNIDESKNEDCVIWNQNQRLLLSEYLRGFTTEVSRRNDGLSTGIAVKYHKQS
jgi:ubiquinone/menaquinone biosynthesis C-methylase UbiE